MQMGHQVRLIAPASVKPYLTGQKNDANDAAAIAEAASRAHMRFVAVKTEEMQARLAGHRIREQLVGQRTATLNALRGHLAEFGFTYAQGAASIRQVADQFLAGETFSLPSSFLISVQALSRQLQALDAEIDALTKQIKQALKDEPTAESPIGNYY